MSILRAHTPDRSYCRVAVGETELVISFAFDFGTLRAIEPIDANRDGAITADELAAFAPAMEEFVRKSVSVRLERRSRNQTPIQQDRLTTDYTDATEEEHVVFTAERPSQRFAVRYPPAREGIAGEAGADKAAPPRSSSSPQTN